MTRVLANGVRLDPAGLGDLAELRAVCLQTGNAGEDATDLYQLPELLGEIYVEPYVRFEPELAFALSDNRGICGYVLGARNTNEFESLVLSRYRAQLLERYRESSMLKQADLHLLRNFASMKMTPDSVVREYLAHLHIDLLPRAQNRGFGKVMITHLLDKFSGLGISGVHLRVAQSNLRAIEFYKKLEFNQVMKIGEEYIFARNLASNRSMLT